MADADRSFLAERSAAERRKGAAAAASQWTAAASSVPHSQSTGARRPSGGSGSGHRGERNRNLRSEVSTRSFLAPPSASPSPTRGVFYRRRGKEDHEEESGITAHGYAAVNVRASADPMPRRGRVGEQERSERGTRQRPPQQRERGSQSTVASRARDAESSAQRARERSRSPSPARPAWREAGIATPPASRSPSCSPAKPAAPMPAERDCTDAGHPAVTPTQTHDASQGTSAETHGTMVRGRGHHMAAAAVRIPSPSVAADDDKDVVRYVAHHQRPPASPSSSASSAKTPSTLASQALYDDTGEDVPTAAGTS